MRNSLSFQFRLSPRWSKCLVTVVWWILVSGIHNFWPRCVTTLFLVARLSSPQAYIGRHADRWKPNISFPCPPIVTELRRKEAEGILSYFSTCHQNVEWASIKSCGVVVCLNARHQRDWHATLADVTHEITIEKLGG